LRELIHPRAKSDRVFNDGPDYSADGKFIYFDSSRSGQLQIWRMRTDGSFAEQLTDDDGRNSSPHLSPDGKSLAFLAQPPGSVDGIGAAAVKIVSLSDGLIRTLTQFQGNRDSFSMYGWGDNNHVAFVSYNSLPVESSGGGAR
jgi:Tol biopolymer transport system component